MMLEHSIHWAHLLLHVGGFLNRPIEYGLSPGVGPQ